MAFINAGGSMTHGRNTTGTINELKAQIWLLNQGYEVFSNVKATGIADLVAWNIKTNQVLKVDVKTVKVYLKKDGSKSYMFSSLGTVGNKAIDSKTDPNITYLGYCEEEDLFLWY
jgi:hypothetical protein